jgi:hypothetical protein
MSEYMCSVLPARLSVIQLAHLQVCGRKDVILVTAIF